jgi:putative membrane protein
MSDFSWARGFFPGGVFSLLVWGLIILALVFLAVRLFGSLRSPQNGWDRDRYDSLQILKVRYVKGELSQDEYGKMRETLLQV